MTDLRTRRNNTLASRRFLATLLLLRQLQTMRRRICVVFRILAGIIAELELFFVIVLGLVGQLVSARF
jgi:hypothetical protein